VRLPPAPILRSLGGTLVVVFALAGGIVIGVSGVTPIDPVASFVWRLGFCTALLAVEFHRRTMRPFLAALGVSRLAVMGSLLVCFLLLEVFYRLAGGI